MTQKIIDRNQYNDSKTSEYMRIVGRASRGLRQPS